MAAPIHLVIADDHPIFRTGLVGLIARDGRFAIVGEAADGPTAQELIQRLRSTIAVLEIDMLLRPLSVATPPLRSRRCSGDGATRRTRWWLGPGS